MPSEFRDFRGAPGFQRCVVALETTQFSVAFYFFFFSNVHALCSLERYFLLISAL